MIGTAICTRLLREGWEIAVFDLREPRQGRWLRCDLCCEPSVTAAFDALGWERIDLLANNGGKVADTRMTLDRATLQGWDKVIASHLTGAFLMSRTALPRMRAGARS